MAGSQEIISELVAVDLLQGATVLRSTRRPSRVAQLDASNFVNVFDHHINCICCAHSEHRKEAHRPYIQERRGMVRSSVASALKSVGWTCRQCQHRSKGIQSQISRFSTSQSSKALETIKAAPEINFGKFGPAVPARVVPSSPSYFSGFPNFNDDLLMLRSLIARNARVPQVPADKAPRMIWLQLTQYRNLSSEQITAYKYKSLLRMLIRLNRIHPQLRNEEVNVALERFQRPGSAALEKAKPGQLDELGRSVGVGRRKAASARVFLVEGTGEVLINGQNLVHKFPRLHDRESALWPLKISSRLSKYNVFALATGGGSTGQAEAITLGLARALLVHEPALKPLLRKGKFHCHTNDPLLTSQTAGCVTRDRRRVERKKPGHVKARKKPAWVKR